MSYLIDCFLWAIIRFKYKPIMLSDERIAKYQAIYKKYYGKEISREDALEQGTKLIRMMQLIYKPMTEAEYDILQKRRKETEWDSRYYLPSPATSPSLQSKVILLQWITRSQRAWFWWRRYFWYVNIFRTISYRSSNILYYAPQNIPDHTKSCTQSVPICSQIDEIRPRGSVNGSHKVPWKEW